MRGLLIMVAVTFGAIIGAATAGNWEVIGGLAAGSIIGLYAGDVVRWLITKKRGSKDEK